MANLSLSTTRFPRQDYVIIDGAKSPGLAVIRGAGSPRNWDKRKGWGASGAWLVPMGNDLAKFQIDIYLWDKATHPDAWTAFAGKCLKKSSPGKLDKAHTIAHPILTWPPLDITQVVIEDVSQPEQDDTGGWIITISCEQYGKPVAVLVKNIDTPGVPNAAPKPADAAEQEVDRLSSQANNLANGTDKSGLF